MTTPTDSSGARSPSTEVGPELGFTLSESFDRLVAVAARTFRVAYAGLSLPSFTFEAMNSLEASQVFRLWGGAIDGGSDGLVRVIEDVDRSEWTRTGEHFTGTVGFYAEAPLEDEAGHRVGTLFIADTAPRTFGEEEREILLQLGALASDALERDRTLETRRALEHKLMDLQRLESLGLLAGGIARDLNNVLEGIMGNVGLALMEAGTGSVVRSHLMDAQIGAQRASDLAREMLAFAGRGAIRKVPTDLNRLLRDLGTLVRASVQRTVELRYDLAPDLPLASCDPTQVAQVILNLTMNAAESVADRPGEVRVRTRVVEARWDSFERACIGRTAPPGTYLLLEVFDNGRGIDDEALERIFDPFFTTKEGGRGLGLAVVKGIVDTHQGALEVRSRRGQGSEFRFYLPIGSATSGAVAARPGGDEQETWSGRGTVLVVDDEEIVRTTAARMLELLGFRVEMASDGVEAMRRFRELEGEISLVLMDVMMPRLAGDAAAKEMADIGPEIPIILMSGYMEEQAGREPVAQRSGGFLQKPFTLHDLRRLLRQAL